MTTNEKNATPGSARSASKIVLRDPVFAAILAFLMPGLGHFYQRRVFKGLLYGVCILGTFFFGMRLGDGKVVYFNWHPEQRTWAYLCQVWAGLPALPALYQAKFRSPESLEPHYVSQRISAPFEGRIGSPGNIEGTVRGQIEIAPVAGEERPGLQQITGKFQGTLHTPQGDVPITGDVGDLLLDPQVAPDARRRVAANFSGQAENHVPGVINGRLQGSIPRSVWNRYEAPLQDDSRRQFRPGDPTDLERAHWELGTRFELGVVYTMIAGLLNVLAIFDAFEGPAYEDDEEEPVPPGEAK